MTVPLLSLLLCVFLFPLAVYCWALALVNRRAGPLVVSGAWDFVGLLLAASGFLLVVGPALLTGLYYRALRELPQAHQAGTVAAILWDLLAYRWGWWLGYYALVVLGSALLLLGRRRRTVVYNVDPALLETALVRALARLGLPWTRQGNRFYLGPPAVAEAEAPAAAPVPPPAAPPPGATAVLDLEPFAFLYNATLHWRGKPGPLRQEVEAELGRELAEVRTDNNPVAGWLLGVSGCLFGLMFVIILVLLFGGALGRR